MYYRKNNGYTIDNKGNIVRWDNPRRGEDEARIKELEYQIFELTQKIQSIENEMKMKEMEMNEARAASFNIEYQDAIEKIRNIKKEIDSIFKG